MCLQYFESGISRKVVFGRNFTNQDDKVFNSPKTTSILETRNLLNIFTMPKLRKYQKSCRGSTKKCKK